MCAHRISRRTSIEELLSSLQHEVNLNPSRPLFKLIYKQSPTWPTFSSKPDYQKPIRIAILDSSFNPPTKAHSQLLVQTVTEIFFQNNKPIIIQEPEKSQQTNEQLESFDACLLLYSTKNADKTITSSDASSVDRLLMMESLASYVQSTAYSDTHSTTALQNLAVGVTTHPRFIDKARAILSSPHCSPPQQLSLYFIVGYDTVIRIFNLQYYTNKQELASFFETNNIICANREGYGGEEAEGQFFQSEIFREIVGEKSEKVIRIKLDNEIAKISSTRVREIVKNELRMENEEDKEQQVKIRNALLELCHEPVVEFVIQEGLYRKVNIENFF